MPSFAWGRAFFTALTAAATSWVRRPPLVSQSTSASAPASKAVLRQARAYSGLFAKPSKKCSASKKSSLQRERRKPRLSAMRARFSGRLTPRAVVAWRSQVLPKMVSTGALHSTRALRLGSLSASSLALRVLPKAATWAFFRA
jgi:hypothetical protein